MRNLFNLLIVILTFFALNVSTVVAQTDSLPMVDHGAAPIGEGGEAGGPAATDMSGNMINDGGHGANSGADAEKEKEEKKAELAACFVKENQKPNMMECMASLFPGFSEKECVIRTCTEEPAGYVEGGLHAPDNDSWKEHNRSV